MKQGERCSLKPLMYHLVQDLPLCLLNKNRSFRATWAIFYALRGAGLSLKTEVSIFSILPYLSEEMQFIFTCITLFTDCPHSS